MPLSSTLTGFNRAVPLLEQSRMVKSIGVSGASNEDDRIEATEASRPTIKRLSDMAQLTLAKGPDPKERLIEPEAVTLVSS